MDDDVESSNDKEEGHANGVSAADAVSTGVIVAKVSRATVVTVGATRTNVSVATESTVVARAVACMNARVIT